MLRLFEFKSFFEFDLRTWDCDTCQADVKAVGAILTSDQASEAVVVGLRGQAFCQDPALGLSEEQVIGCQDFISAFMPAALQTFFRKMDENSDKICANLYQC